MILLILINLIFTTILMINLLGHDYHITKKIKKGEPLEPRDFLIFKINYNRLKHPEDD